jgi:hypothetical protein
MDQPAQRLSAVLEESAFDRMAPQQRAFTFNDFLWRLPIYAIFIVFGALLAYPFVRGRFNKSVFYMAVIMGVLVYQLIKVTQIPLQQWYTLNYLIPGIRSGGSIYTLTLFPSLAAAFFQEFLKLLPLVLLWQWKKPRQTDLIALGVFCGLGMGVYEACYLTGAPFQAGTLGILSWGVWERLFAIVFHAVAGAVFGYALSRGWLKLLMAVLTMILIRFVTGYLIVFVQSRAIDVALMQIIHAMIVLITVLVAYLHIKASRRRALRRQ